ncbi:hypothetical protein [Enterococcus wangshanyuanii]|uniref:Uncharacterized protein n=2 Tax=Enterococcus wangshanyuanii TaxID=2005703 RepID=A0ABQ1PX51_9ENTE|nr:hypothetical protein [Enterococcus wangshanyuanii]GGD06311.1 hypothetical protein GCM10011573_39660 [Enterococcus wangshanyuanii]
MTMKRYLQFYDNHEMEVSAITKLNDFAERYNNLEVIGYQVVWNEQINKKVTYVLVSYTVEDTAHGKD